MKDLLAGTRVLPDAQPLSPVIEIPQPNLAAGMKWLCGKVGARPGPSHFGKAVQEAEAVQAERSVFERLKRGQAVEMPCASLRNAITIRGNSRAFPILNFMQRLRPSIQ